MNIKRFCLAALSAFVLATGFARAQEAITSEAEVFDANLTILDTAIPFTIGSRQARQRLRGAFGWDTFQEGVIDGVYFRFDPDGYARFAPNPRLDTDVFEVMCRPRTRTCTAQKGSLGLELTNRLTAVTKIDELLEADRIFIADGLSEIEVPARAVGELDKQMELLLATGTELVVRRGETETTRVSLAGFHAVISYLRWVATKQDYAVLPSDWPMPSSLNAEIVQENNLQLWGGDTVQPQNRPITQSAAQTQPQSPIQQTEPAADQMTIAGQSDAELLAEIEQLRIENNLLRELVLSYQLAGGASPESNDLLVPTVQPASSSALEPTDSDAVATSSPDMALGTQEDVQPELGLALEALTNAASPGAQPTAPLFETNEEIGSAQSIIAEGISESSVQDSHMLSAQSAPQNIVPVQGQPTAVVAERIHSNDVRPSDEVKGNSDTSDAIAARLVYLIDEFGLEPNAAMDILQILEIEPGSTGASFNDTLSELAPELSEVEIPDPLIDEMGLALDVPAVDTAQPDVPDRGPSNEDDADGYLVLSDFLESGA